MAESNPQHKSELISVLREGVGVVQMVLFKELRTIFTKKYTTDDTTFRSMLTGAVINTLFGNTNPAEKFITFGEENRGTIEQELLALADELTELKPFITDALRIQTLCDNQEGEDSSDLLVQAEKLNLLLKEREIPLPSTFMTRIRQLGEQHGLTIAPVEITPDQDGVIQ